MHIINADLPVSFGEQNRLGGAVRVENQEQCIGRLSGKITADVERGHPGIFAGNRNHMGQNLIGRSHAEYGMRFPEGNQALVVFHCFQIGFLIEQIPLDGVDRIGRFETVFKSVTSDNGSEFVDLGRYLPKSTKVYYAHPYSSYERGTNERQNALVRRFFPKGRSFDNVTDEQVAFVEHWINNLPRKIFNYHCSDFLFQNVLFDIAI